MHTLESATFGAHLQNHDPQTPPVRGDGKCPRNGFRCRVTRGLPRNRHLQLKFAKGRGAEVGNNQIQRLARTNEHVGRLEVAVADIDCFEAGQGLADLRNRGADKIGAGFFGTWNFRQRPVRNKFPDFKGPFLEPARIQQARAVVRVEFAQGRVESRFRFDAGAGQTLALRGSDNQRVHLSTPLAQARYSNLPTARRDATPALDVVFDGDDVWLAGIPAPGDLNRLRQKLAEDGFSAGTSEAPAVLA